MYEMIFQFQNSQIPNDLLSLKVVFRSHALNSHLLVPIGRGRATFKTRVDRKGGLFLVEGFQNGGHKCSNALTAV